MWQRISPSYPSSLSLSLSPSLSRSLARPIHTPHSTKATRHPQRSASHKTQTLSPTSHSVGTIYKGNPFEARKVGSALVSANIANIIRDLCMDKPKDWRPLVYCWRGGQRSSSISHVSRSPLTLNLESQTLDPRPLTSNSRPQTLGPQPSTLHPIPRIPDP